MISADFRAEARKRLSGRWGKAACISLAYIAILFVLSFIYSRLQRDSFIKFIFPLATAIIEIPLAFGLIISFYKLYNFEDIKAFDFLFLGFEHFKKAWSITLCVALKLLVPCILLIVSNYMIVSGAFFGIISALYQSTSTVTRSSVFNTLIFFYLGHILFRVSLIWLIVKSYYYQLSQIVAIDNPNLTSKEAVLRSKELMQNKRGKLFCLHFSFIGWWLLIIILFCICLTFSSIYLAIPILLACAIGIILLSPYMQFAIFAFYNFVTGNSNKVEIVNSEEHSNDDPIQNN